MRPGALEIRDNINGSTHTLKLAGELDLATAGELETEIQRVCAAGAREVVLDLDQLVFMDCTGLRHLMAAKSRCEQDCRGFALMHVRGPVKRLFELAGMAGEERRLAA